MPTLLDFPPELVGRLLGLLLPKDLEASAQVCDYFHKVAKPYISEHKKLKKQYAMIRTNAAYDYVLRKTLFAILRDPGLGYYVRHLKIRNLYVSEDFEEEFMGNLEHHSDDAYSECSEEDALVSAEDMRYANEALRVSPYFHAHEIASMSTDIESGSGVAMISLLLTLLPNLRVLQFDLNYEMSRTYMIIGRIASDQTFGRRNVSTSDKPLHEIRSVLFDNIEDIDFPSFTTFMALPLMKSVVGNCVGIIPDAPSFQVPMSNLTVLVLRFYTVEEHSRLEGLFEVIRNTVHLTSLTCTSLVIKAEAVRELCQVITKHLRLSLEHLDLSNMEYVADLHCSSPIMIEDEDEEDEEDDRPLIWLGDCPALKSVHLDYDLLCPATLDKGADCLPRALKTLKISDPRRHYIWAEQILQMIRPNGHLLPNLSTLYVPPYQQYITIVDLRDACLAGNILFRLTTDDTPEQHALPTSFGGLEFKADAGDAVSDERNARALIDNENVLDFAQTFRSSNHLDNWAVDSGR